MKPQPTRRKAPWSALLGLVALMILGVAFVQFMSRFGDVFSASETPTPYPTDYPPDKQTLEAELRQTDEALAQTPMPTGTIWSFPPRMQTQIPLPTLPATPAGAGKIVYRDDLPGQLLGMTIVNTWFENAGDRTFQIFAGADLSDPSQGLLYVGERLLDFRELPDGGYYTPPTKEGALRIVDAQGERLILQSENGTTFYFDVRGQTFVSSISEVVPTATFWPTPPPEPTKTPAFTDDLPNDPYDVLVNSPVNTNLRFLINPVGDLDWFRFFLPVTATLQIHLESLPANYDLYVYSATQPRTVFGISTKPGKQAERISLKEAPPDDYYVLVTNVAGTFDTNNPYQLRFEVPGLPGSGPPQP